MLATDFKKAYKDSIRGECAIDQTPKRLIVKEQAIIVKPYPAPDEKYWWNRLEQGIYDSLGRHVVDLSDRRGSRNMLWPRRHVSNYICEDLTISPETIIYGGSLYSHFGYLILESLARCYFFASMPEFDKIPIVFYGDGDANKDVINLSYTKGILKKLVYRKIEFVLLGPTYDTTQSFSLPSSFHDEASFSPALGRWMSAAAKRVMLREDDAVAHTLAVKSRKAFISRSAITSGSSIAINAQEIDAIMAASKFDVLHPETLPLDEQIDIFRRYDLVAGMPSSFFHLKMLSGTETRCFYLVPEMEDGIASNFINIDEGMNYRDKYITYKVTEAEKVPRFQRAYAANLNSFREGLRSLS